MTPELWQEIGIGLWETLYSSVLATIFAFIIGLPLGVLLAITDRGGLKQNLVVNKILGIIVNVLRSVPFLILFVTVLPFTRLVVGTSLGATAAIVPLTIAAAPFVARLVETSVKEVDSGVIEAALSFGTPTIKIICKAILPEIIPSLLSNAAIAFVTVIGYSAMTGFCGGGGLGAIAINYGYYRGNTKIMLVTVVIIVIIVQIFQELGLMFAKKRDKRRKSKNK
ncbi:MAG: ABC transporter permease [Bacteroides sp.]|nr:ABC transporter permease [Bacillota bacterium]MCM1393464.1 ABC transporter permease [[Eubacterium] siraeum]MCM1455302.1 ABC transporter permease [Bacteroides sp.]